MQNNLENWISRIQLIAQNKDFIIIYKPEGLSFYEDGPRWDLMKIIRYMEKEKILPEGERIFPVHRIDKITSGIVLFARGRKASNLLGNQFRHKKIEKIYLAISLEKPKKKQGIILGDMIKDRRSKWKLQHSTTNPSITMFKSFPIITEQGEYLRLFLVKPITGKTHQIRVVLKSLSSPILGDPLYSRPSIARQQDRTYLHAYGIQFKFEGKQYQYIVPPNSGKYFLNKDVDNFIKQLGNPFELNWNYKIPKKLIPQ